VADSTSSRHLSQVGSSVNHNSPEVITTDLEKLTAIREWPTPKNKHEFRSFLRLCAYNRRFISSFGEIAKRLTELTEEKQAFQWTREMEIVFRTLKEALCTGPILACAQPRERFVVDTGGSNVGTGGVLSQVQGR
jgi:hypothetical protein